MTSFIAQFAVSIRNGLAAGALILVSLTTAAAAQGFETAAEQAILIDFETGTVLLNKNADRQMYPASMTKIMTAYMAFERLREGSLTMADTFRVSEKAWRKGGSKMFVEIGSDVTVADLLRGVIVQSGNDASIVLAEGIAGSEESFANLMTDRAHELGMINTVFINSTGWPDENHVTTARDMARLAMATIHEYPQYYSLFAETNFEYNGIDQSNRNPLLFLDVGSDGLKTGHTEASGYGLTASAVRDDRRMVMVINGLSSERERSTESSRLIGWGFANFDNHNLLAAGEVVEEVNVWMGQSQSVPVTVGEDIKITLARTSRSDLTVRVQYSGPVPAPIEAGTEIATLVIDAPGLPTIERPLLAMQTVERLGFFGRQTRRIKEMVFGPLQAAQ